MSLHLIFSYRRAFSSRQVGQEPLGEERRVDAETEEAKRQCSAMQVRSTPENEARSWRSMAFKGVFCIFFFDKGPI